MGKRKRYTTAFKAEAVARLDEGGKTLTMVASELGVHVNQLRTWRNEILAAGSAGALAQQKADAAELQRLRGQGGVVRVHGGLLQSAAAAFRHWPSHASTGLRADESGRLTYLTYPSSPEGEVHS